MNLDLNLNLNLDLNLDFEWVRFEGSEFGVDWSGC